MSADKKSAATLLVDIAEDLFTFGCVTERPPTGDSRVDWQAAVLEYASPRGNPSVKRPLLDIRPDLAQVYEAT
jgi:hypothetical protein